MNKKPREGYIMPGFEQLKKDPTLQEKFVNAFIQAHDLPTAYRSRLKRYLQLAIDSAEEIARYLGREGKYSIRPEQFQEFEKFNKFLETVMEDEFGVRPRKITKRKAERQRKRRIVRPEEIFASQLSELDDEFDEFEEEEAPKPEFPETKKVVFPELLAVAKALEYSAFSPEAMKRAEEDLLERLDELLESPEENALEVAYTVKLLRMVQKRDIEGIKGFAKGETLRAHS